MFFIYAKDPGSLGIELALKFKALFRSGFAFLFGTPKCDAPSEATCCDVHKRLEMIVGQTPDGVGGQKRYLQLYLNQSWTSLKELLSACAQVKFLRQMQKIILSSLICSSWRELMYRLLPFLHLRAVKQSSQYLLIKRIVSEVESEKALPEVHQLGCQLIKKLHKTVRAFYFHWLMVILGYAKQIQHMLRYLETAYRTLEVNSKKCQTSYWLSQRGLQAKSSYDFAHRVLNKVPVEQSEQSFQAWSCVNKDELWLASGERWAGAVHDGFSGRVQVMPATVKSLILQADDFIEPHLVKLLKKELEYDIKSGGHLAFYSARWSVWMSDRYHKFVIWDFLQSADWREKTKCLLFLHEHAASAYAWAKDGHLSGLAGLYREAMVSVGFVIDGGSNNQERGR